MSDLWCFIRKQWLQEKDCEDLTAKDKCDYNPCISAKELDLIKRGKGWLKRKVKNEIPQD